MATAEAGKAFLEVLVKETGYFDSVLHNVRDIRVPEPGRLLCSLRVEESMQNRFATHCSTNLGALIHLALAAGYHELTAVALAKLLGTCQAASLLRQERNATWRMHSHDRRYSGFRGTGDHQ